MVLPEYGIGRLGCLSQKKHSLKQWKERRKVDWWFIFSTGKYTTFWPGNNIKNVVFRSYEEKQNYLHLTFQNNTFLFIKRLSSRDAEELKMFLDRVCQKKYSTTHEAW